MVKTFLGLNNSLKKTCFGFHLRNASWLDVRHGVMDAHFSLAICD